MTRRTTNAPGWVAALGVICLLTATPARAQPKAIRFAQLWDGARVIPNALVLVDGDRIMAIESGGTAPPGSEVVDLRLKAQGSSKTLDHLLQDLA
jgi:hypothetical protein